MSFSSYLGTMPSRIQRGLCVGDTNKTMKSKSYKNFAPYRLETLTGNAFMLYLVQNLRNQVLSVLWLIEKGKKRLCQGNKVMNLAGVLGRNWGKECFVNKSVRQKQTVVRCSAMLFYVYLE